MPGNMEVDVTKWSHSQMNDYLDTTIQGFTESQVGHMAWYLGIKHEQMLREKEMTMRQQDNMSDEPADEDIPEL
jgi:hypothetical protein